MAGFRVPDHSGKLAIVTGANGGTGKQAARGLADVVRADHVVGHRRQARPGCGHCRQRVGRDQAAGRDYRYEDEVHMTFDPTIRRRNAVKARAFQLVYPAMNRLLLSSPKVELAPHPVPPPTTVRIPTRYGSIEALVYSPTPESIVAQRAQGQRPPVHMLIHGGAFILQYTKGEGNVARYLAAELGCYVVMPDYRAAPQVCHPVAQHECFDAYRWIREAGPAHG